MLHYYTYIAALLLLVSSCAPRSHNVDIRSVSSEKIEMTTVPSTDLRQKVVDFAGTLVGIQEKGSNRGEGVEMILSHSGLQPGTPYCGATVIYIYDKCGVTHIMDARARSCCVSAVATNNPQPGDAVGMWWNGGGVVQHTGIYLGRQDEFVLTIEGNTSNPSDKREEGVYRKSRSVEHTPLVFGNHIDYDPA